MLISCRMGCPFNFAWISFHHTVKFRFPNPYFFSNMEFIKPANPPPITAMSYIFYKDSN